MNPDIVLMRRCGKPHGNINDRVAYVDFFFDKHDDCVDIFTAHATRTKADGTPADALTQPWNWRNARSLLSTGDWVIIDERRFLNGVLLSQVPTSGETLEGGAW